MDCDCKRCEKLTWGEWLDGEPGPWGTAITWTLAAAAIICLVNYLI